MSAEAKRIGDDYSRSVEARKAALAELGRTTTTEIQGLLGNEAAAAYLDTMKESFEALARGYIVELKNGARVIRSLNEPPP